MDKNGNLSKEKILEYVLKEEKNPKGVEKKAEKIFKEWKRAFDRESPQGVINFIETEFLPVEKKFLDGEIWSQENIRKSRKFQKSKK